MSERLRQGVKPVSVLARWLLPSLGSFCLLLVLYWLIANSWRFLLDSDTGWHIRTGDWIRQTHAVPRQDLFSFTLAGREWFAWEWLADVLMSAIHSTRGLAGLVAAAILLLSACYAALYRMMLARGADPILACVLTVMAALLSMIHWLARPHVLSIGLMIVWYGLMESYRRRRSRWVYAVPLLLLIWANVHGAFVITFVMLVIYAVGETLEFISRGEGKSQKLRTVLSVYALLGGLSLIATLVTPYGFKLYAHLWSYLNDRALLALIPEFHSPDFNTLDGQMIEIFLLLGVVAAMMAARQRRFVEIGLLLLWSHLTLQAERHVTLAVVVMMPMIAEHWSALLGQVARAVASGQSAVARLWRAALDWYRNLRAIDRQLNGAAVYVAVAVFMIALSGSRQADQLLSPRFDAQRFPVAAADFIATAKLPGNMYAHDQYGGYLIYRLSPQVKVFADGRSDFYRQSTVIEDMNQISTAKPTWQAVLDKYGVGWMLLRRNEPVGLLAKMSGQWVSVYSDATAQVLVKKTTTASEVAKQE